MKNIVSTPLGYINLISDKEVDNVRMIYSKSFPIKELNEKEVRSYEVETKKKVVTPFGCAYVKTQEYIYREQEIIDSVFSDMPKKTIPIIYAY